MQTSVFKEIPDNSIAGTKILDDTDVNRFGTVYAERFYGRDSVGFNAARILTTGNLGSIKLYSVTQNQRFYFTGDPAVQSYVKNIIVFGSDTPTYSTTTYPTQVVGGFAVNGNGYFSGNITLNYLYASYLQSATGYFSSNVTVGGLLNVSAGSGIRVGAYTPSAAAWQNMSTQQTTLKDLTANEVAQLKNIDSAEIGSSEWLNLEELNQNVGYDSDPKFKNLSTDDFSSDVQTVDADISTADDPDWSILVYGTVGINDWTLTLSHGGTIRAGKWYYVQNKRGSGSGNVILTPAGGNNLLGGSASATLANNEACILIHIGTGNWVMLKGVPAL